LSFVGTGHPILNGIIQVELILKGMTFWELKKVSMGKYYLLEVNLPSHSSGVTLEAKICIPVGVVQDIQQNKKSGKIGSILYSVKPNQIIAIKTISSVPAKNVQLKDGKYMIHIIQDSKSIINIDYSVPKEIYENLISQRDSPEKSQTKAIKEDSHFYYSNDPVIERPFRKEEKNIRKQEGRIYVAKDTAFKRCEHCISFRTNQMCMTHKQKVQSNNACSRFYSPKIYLGGLVSPR
jgi:hypothetical protein